jgi:hypothetical protein
VGVQVKAVKTRMQVEDRIPQSEKVAASDRTQVASTTAEGWGWLPALSLVGALGVLQMALADNAARGGASWAVLLFWTALLTLFVPMAARLLMPAVARRERIGLLAVLGLELYVAVLLLSPIAFTDFDDFAHWRTTLDIAQTNHLFQPNPLLPISAQYPGLEIITQAISSLTGLSIFTAGIIVIGVARLIGVLALYLLFEVLIRSAWAASIGTLLYMANPHFLFFDAAFSYESLALPLALLVLYAVARRSLRRDGTHAGWTMTIWLGLATVVITHHLTSYALAAFLVLWAVALVVVHRGLQIRGEPGGAALLAIVLSLVWVVYVGSSVIGYVAPHVTAGLQQLAQVLLGKLATRQLFHDGAGSVTPRWEQMTAYAAVGLILVGVPFGLSQIWKRYRDNAAAIALGIAALAYPASQALRLTQEGAETAERASEFLFVAIAFVLAVGATEVWLRSPVSWPRHALATVAAAIIFVGGVVGGSGPTWNRLPGPYLVSADQRSVTPEGIDAATWASAYLGPGHLIATDRVNQLLMGTYGRQHVVTGADSHLPVVTVFFSAQLDAYDRAILRKAGAQYLVIDHRLSTGLPRVGVFYEIGEPGAFQHTTPMSPALLSKYDAVPGVGRVFDSGDIVIYDVREADHAP